MSVLAKKLLTVVPTAGGVEPVGVDFDGTNDYLSRSTDLVGNTDSKTFTFSAWVYNPDGHPDNYVLGSNYVRIYVDSSENAVSRLYVILGSNSSISQGVLFYVPNSIPRNTWCHILFSMDTSSSSLRRVFINDLDVTSFASFTRYENKAVDFTGLNWGVSANDDAGKIAINRLAHVYLDYTYRDLSVEANRRLFIDADGRPADGQASLSPILYLPMDDPDDPGRNDGTGGDFTLNGTVAQAGRGPNQYNAAASTFDGSNDYLSRSSALVGVSAGKSFTISFHTSCSDPDNYPLIISNESGDNFTVIGRITSNQPLKIVGRNSSNVTILEFDGDTILVDGKFYHIAVSVDLTDTLKRGVFVDGVEESGTWTTYTNDSLALNGSRQAVAANRILNPTASKTSDLWFDTTYIDLSTNNPFWDADTGKPAYLGVNGELPTGSSPLIYLPLRADDAGSNKGTGGDFTVNSGPFVGARGPSEFWAGSADFGTDSEDFYLQKTGDIGGSESKTCSFAFAFNTGFTSSNNAIFAIGNSSSSIAGFYVRFTTTNEFGAIGAIGKSGQVIEGNSTTENLPINSWATCLICVDSSDQSKTKVYVNGIEHGMNWTQFNDRFMDFESTNVYIGNQSPGVNIYDGKGSQFYFTTDYIDFSQEANRLKFVDAFGYPVDIQPKIESGEIPTPLIYMPFDDPDDLGKNLGTGGDFTVNGTVTQGGDVKG